MEKFRHFKDDREDGFSLVELLVVIVIIGILSAIAIGAFLNQRKKANDAALQSDLRTAANEIVAWSVDNDMQDFKDSTVSGWGTSMILTGENAVDHNLNNATKWNDVEGFPTINLSEGNMIEIVMKWQADNNTGVWHTAHEESEFCLVGSSPNSSYNYIPGVSGGAHYDKYLYWDAKLGGVVQMSDLVEAKQSGQTPSCYGYADVYLIRIAEQGGTQP